MTRAWRLGAVLVVVLTAGTQALAATPFCSISPYDVDLFVIDQSPVRSTITHRVVAPGECHALQTEPGTALFVHAEPADSDRRVRDLRNDARLQLAWQKQAGPSAGQSAGPLFCLRRAPGMSIRPAGDARKCSPDESEARFTALSHGATGSPGIWLLADPVICARSEDVDCSTDPLSALVRWAKHLGRALAEASAVARDRSVLTGFLPLDPGFRVRDANGPYSQGVEVVSVHAAALQGDARIIQPGDLLVGLAGRPLYGVGNFLRAVFDAGSAGYGVPHELALVRGNDLRRVTVTFTFNASIFGPYFWNDRGDGCKPLRNIASGVFAAANSYTFDQQSRMYCAINSIIHPNSGFESCRFERTQLYAAFAQFCPAASQVGALGGGLGFVARPVVARTLTGAVPALGGTRLGPRLLRAALLEGGEEFARVYMAADIDATSSEILKAAQHRAMQQGVIGVGAQLFPRAAGVAMGALVLDAFRAPGGN